MVNTFLPVADIRQSAEILDKKRCWSQVREAAMILKCLSGESKGWVNHPATRMWRGYDHALKVYFNEFLWATINIHDIKVQAYTGFDVDISDNYALPPWFGCSSFHASHRSNLLRKNYSYYSQFGWTEPDDLDYIWPVDKQGNLVGEIENDRAYR